MIQPARRKRLEKLDREQAAEIPHDHEWTKRPEIASLGLTEWFWRDPEPESTAVLTADRIRAYHYAVGRMIRPFQEKHLNAASYDLTLGPLCVIDGREEILSPVNPVLRIEPGSIALVTPREMLLIPHWLVATFNLKSEYIFKGLLMGIGPQIDPGFMGMLTCPLHNISCEPVCLNFCEQFAKLDFVKTTWGEAVDLDGVASEDDLYDRADENRLAARDGERITLWPRSENFRAPINTGRQAAGVKGSLAALEAKMSWFRRNLRIGWAGAIVGALALLTMIAAVFTMLFLYTDGRIHDVKGETLDAARAEVESLMKSPPVRARPIFGRADRASE